MPTGQEYRFVIDAFTPETMPMARLAEYMADLAELLGEKSEVHFVRVDSGSVAIVQSIEVEAIPKVRERLAMAHRGDASTKVMNAFSSLNARLSIDNGTGKIESPDGAVILRFPGVLLAQDESFGVISQPGSLDGVVIRVGGKRDDAPVTLQDGENFYNCFSSRSIAKQLGAHLFSNQIRVYGNGRWFRDDEGIWRLKEFAINSFEMLDETPLLEIVRDLRGLPGNNWNSIENPWTELDVMRNGSVRH